MGDIETIELMDVDSGDENVDYTSTISNRTKNGTSTKRKRKAPSNIRHENMTNRMTRLGKSHIHYSDDIILGRGATAVVYEGYYQFPEKHSAVKRVFGKFADVSKTEIEIWKKIGTTVCAGNVNVVQLFEYKPFHEGRERNFYFAMELAKANLDETVKSMKEKNDPLWKQKTIGYLEDGAKGLSWLHTKRVIHRDVKPQNFLVYDVNGKEVCKICDFGISKKLSDLSTGTDSMGQGTSDWMAPEALKSRIFEEPIITRYSLDIFSFGMTAHFAMSQGVHPFHKSEKFGIDKGQNIMSDEVNPTRLQNEANEADHLFSWAMSKDAKLRPTINQMLLHPFFWRITKKLEFIVDFAKCMDNRKDKDVSSLWSKIDQSYQNRFNRKFDWKAKLDNKRIEYLFGKMEVKTNMQLKKYDCNSLMSMVSLLRDKDMHYKDLDEEFFGVVYEGQFCINRDKFINYFTNLYRDFIIFIYVFLVQESHKHPFLKTMRQNNKLNHFSNGIKDI